MSSPPYTTDTSPDADAMQLELIRSMAPSERAERALRLTSEMLRHAKAAIRRQHPEFDENQVGIKFIELHYGEQIAQGARRQLQGLQR